MKSNRTGQNSGLTQTRSLLAKLRDGQAVNSSNQTNPPHSTNSEKVWDRRSNVSEKDFNSDPHRLFFEVFRDPLVELAKLRKLPPRQREAYFQGLIKIIVSNLDDKNAIRAVRLLQDEWRKYPSERSFVNLVQSI